MSTIPYDINAVVDSIARDCGFSGVVRICSGGEPVVEAAFGYADRANGLPNTAGTRFGIASGTKFITSLATMRLVEKGLFDYSTCVADLVDGRITCIDPRATVHHLLCHTSGVFDYYDEELIEDFDNFEVSIPWFKLETPLDYLPLFREQKMKFAAGERFSYSNGGYVLLGIIIEKVTGQVFRDVVQKEVLAPAGCVDSGFFALNQLPERTAIGYVDGDDGSWKTNVFQLPLRGAGDGGLFMTARDVTALWSAFLSDTIVSAETRRLACAPHATIQDGLRYGYGVYLSDRFEESSLMIVGSDAGVGFDSRYFPSEDLEITFMSNETDGQVELRNRVLSRLFPNGS